MFFQYVLGLENVFSEDVTIDRINNNSGYEPGNIRLVSVKENANNRRTTTFIEYEGTSYPYSVFCEKFTPLWTSPNTLRYHLDRGKTIEYAMDVYRKTASVRRT